jgi:hypothetical protein
LEIFEFEVCRFLNKSKNDFLKKTKVDRRFYWAERVAQAGPAVHPGAGGSKKKGAASRGPHVSVYSNPKGYLAIQAVGFKRIRWPRFVFSRVTGRATGALTRNVWGGGTHRGGLAANGGAPARVGREAGG